MPLSLISEKGKDGGLSQGDTRQATKANIHAVLDLLAGKGEGERDRLRREVGSEIDKLAKATPDDLVILAYSGHGYADERSRFYLVPSERTETDILPAVLPRLISSEELTAWLREVDAGEMVMIVDACHSAAGVPEGLKPGPMGDRGLGQLAYDKGMRILAATQANDVALESGQIGQGLLTYALVEDGLKKGLAAPKGDGVVTLTEWLQDRREARARPLRGDQGGNAAPRHCGTGGRAQDLEWATPWCRTPSDTPRRPPSSTSTKPTTTSPERHEGDVTRRNQAQRYRLDLLVEA